MESSLFADDSAPTGADDLPTWEQWFVIDDLGRLAWYAKKKRLFDKQRDNVKQLKEEALANIQVMQERIDRDEQNFADRFDEQAIIFVMQYNALHNIKAKFVDTSWGRVQVAEAKERFKVNAKVLIAALKQAQPWLVKTREVTTIEEYIEDEQMEHYQRTVADETTGEKVPMVPIEGVEYVPASVVARVSPLRRPTGINTAATQELIDG